jgi:hypothetical protein
VCEKGFVRELAPMMGPLLAGFTGVLVAWLSPGLKASGAVELVAYISEGLKFKGAPVQVLESKGQRV